MKKHILSLALIAGVVSSITMGCMSANRATGSDSTAMKDSTKMMDTSKKMDTSKTSDTTKKMMDTTKKM